MRTSQIAKRFMNYFEQQGHLVVPSASLISPNPTTLFTIAGNVPALPNLPRAYDGFRIVHLTDLHASRLLQRDWMQAVVARANALEPDLTLITGDLVDGTPAARAASIGDWPAAGRTSPFLRACCSCWCSGAVSRNCV